MVDFASGSGINILGLLCSSAKMNIISVLPTSQGIYWDSKVNTDVKVLAKCRYHETIHS